MAFTVTVRKSQTLVKLYETLGVFSPQSVTNSSEASNGVISDFVIFMYTIVKDLVCHYFIIMYDINQLSVLYLLHITTYLFHF